MGKAGVHLREARKKKNLLVVHSVLTMLILSQKMIQSLVRSFAVESGTQNMGLHRSCELSFRGKGKKFASVS